MIRAIIFDCFGVLYGSSAEIPRAICPVDLQAEFDSLVKQADYGYITGDEYAQQCAELLDMPLEALRRILYDQWARNEPLTEYLQTLRPKYKVGLLSNISTGTINRLISPEEQAKWFDVVALSGELHMTKPDPAIFTYVAEQLGLQPEECVMIDDREVNCDGAARAGMHTVWFASNEQAIRELEYLLSKVD